MTQAAYDIPDKTTLDELRHMAHEHLSWLQSDGRQGRRANLSGRDLSGMTLQGIYLPEANLRGAILTGTNLSMANLQGADFSEAILENTNLRDAKLENANFSRCSAKGTYFDQAKMIEVNFSHSYVDAASFVHADLAGVKFRDADVSRSNFSRANLQHANMRHITAQQAQFYKADLTQADCRDAIFNYSGFKESIIDETNLRGASFDNVIFSDTDFSRGLDLDPSYQAQSLESEKQGIRQEIDNLRKLKDEVTQYEDHVAGQKRELMQRRKTLDSLNDVETEVSQSLATYMKRFRNIAMFWSAVTAMFGTVLSYKVAEIGFANLNWIEIIAVSAVLIGVLGAHIYSAVLAFNVSRRFARYVRLRREKLFMSNIPLQNDLKGQSSPFDQHEDLSQHHRESQESGVTYL